MAADPTEPARPESAGLYSLFETTIPRLKREHFGFRIADFEGIKRDTGVQDFVDELIGALSDIAPIDLRTPLAINNNSGGDSITINGGDVDNGITINSNQDSSVHIGPTGITWTNNLGDTITIGGVTVNEGGTQVFNDLSQNITNISNTTINIGDGNNHRPVVIEYFRLTGSVLSKLDTPCNGVMLTCDPDDEPDPVPIQGDFHPGQSVNGDIVVAIWDWCDSVWYAFATNHRFTTDSFVAWRSEGDISIVVNDDCTITASGLSQVTLKDGLVHSITGV